MSKRDYSQTFGVAGAVIEKEGKILLVKETKEIAKDLWSHPAGWIEVGEDPLDAVKKEVKEETGYDFSPTYIIGIYSLYKKNLKEKFDITPHPIKIIFSGKISENSTGELAKDISENKWFLAEEIYQMDKNTLRDIDIKQMIKDYFAGKKYPLELLTHIISE
jgi:ADP-ribose pyrophosphatase YjhB (NUDIX family)